MKKKSGDLSIYIAVTVAVVLMGFLMVVVEDAAQRSFLLASLAVGYLMSMIVFRVASRRQGSLAKAVVKPYLPDGWRFERSMRTMPLMLIVYPIIAIYLCSSMAADPTVERGAVIAAAALLAVLYLPVLYFAYRKYQQFKADPERQQRRLRGMVISFVMLVITIALMFMTIF